MIPFTVTVRINDDNALVFARDDLSELSYVQSLSFDGNAVEADKFTAVIRQTDPDWLSQWSGVSRNTPVFLSRAERAEKFYFLSLRRVSKSWFELSAQSPIARLSSNFNGGLYDGQPLPQIIAAVMGDIPFSVHPLLASVLVYGWAPYATRRETIHYLSLAYGFLIRRDQNHDLFFTVPDTESYPMPPNAFYTGGSVAYRVGETYSRADIAAADFLPLDASPVTLFDNAASAPVRDHFVKFDSPMFSLAASDTLSIADSGVNFAVVSGAGTLTGIPYTKITSVVSVPGDPDADTNQILSVSDAPLITSLNAASVGERLLNYRNAPAVVSVDILRTGQKTGDFVAFTDPFGDARDGYITDLSGSVTSIDKAAASIVCGFSPSWGAAYDSVEVLSGSGSWTVPDYLDAKTLRVILIGGGSGGNSGQHGSDTNGLGCGRGIPGSGGPILDVKFTAHAGDVFPYSTGSGGAGGAYTDATTDQRPDTMTVYVTRTGDRWHINPHCNGGTYTPTTLRKAVARRLSPCENCVRDNAPYYVSNPGQPGTPSTFGDFSSADGAPSDVGIYDPIRKILYAAPAPDFGVDGGPATSGDEIDDRLYPYYNHLQRASVALPWDAEQVWIGGIPGFGKHDIDRNPSGTVETWAYGGLGGGAAVGNNGPDGHNAPFPEQGGNGANGADAQSLFPSDPLPFGSGGFGGHGGGQAAPGGSGHVESSYDSGVTPSDGNPGSGGAGSDGQPGQPGCILLYFKKPNAYQYFFTVRNGLLILTYYTPEPPPFSLRQDCQLCYTVADGQSPPAFQIRNGYLYLVV